MSKELKIPEGGAFATLKGATTDAERYEAGRFATTPVDVPGFTYPVPPLFFDLPWADDDDEVAAGILAQIAGAADIEKATTGAELTDPYDIIGEPVTVLGGVARRSDIPDAKIGAYLSLTVSVDGGDPEVINTGAGEVYVVFWRMWCEGRVPFRGSFTLKGTPKKGRKQPLGFKVESAL